MTDSEKQTLRIGAGKPGPGRKKGVPNKVNALLRDAILEAATNAGGKEGLVGYLEKQAMENPSSFLPLLGKVLPMQVAATVETHMSKEQRDAAVAAALRADY
jgi:hypothetical protein